MEEKRWYRALVVVLLLVLGALACNAPGAPTDVPPTAYVPEQTFPPAQPTTPPAEPTTPPAEPTAPAEPTIPPGSGVAYDGITFVYDPSITSGVTPETVPAEEYEYEVPWPLEPAHVRFNFTGYALVNTFHEPRIAVYSVAEYEASDTAVAGTIDNLRRLLRDRPAAPDPVPFLPVWNAAQLMRSNVAYLDFENGSGVRFLTEYGQYSAPINNQDLFYTFQGLTTDGAWYVSAILPIAHPSLQADPSTVPGGDWGAFTENYVDYIRDIVAQLEAAPAASFTPRMDLLDGMIRSLRVR